MNYYSIKIYKFNFGGWGIMEILVQGKLLDVLSKEYEFEGQKGISYQLVVYQNGSMEKIKVSKDTSEHFKAKVGQDVNLKCKIFINGKYSLSLNK